MTDKLDFEAALNQLRQAFAEKIPAKVEAIRQQWEALLAAPGNTDACQLLHRSAHTLNGTGSTYGFTEIAKKAEVIELMLEQPKKDHAAWVDEIAPGIELLINDLERLARTELLSDDEPLPSSASGLNELQPTQEVAKRVIYLADNDPDFLSTMKAQIQVFGYEVETFSDPAIIKQAVAHRVPLAVIMETSFGGSEEAGIECIHKINSRRDEPVKTIFIKGSDHMETRLNAVRAGGLDYFPGPVPAERLIDALDHLTRPSEEEVYRIAIVDDSEEQSSLVALTLEKAGLQTRQINNPLQLLDVLSEFSPDLILLDIYMPGCNGLELSRVIRQMDAYVSTPIVFLSTEHDLEKQLGAMSLGGDDFLSKPVQPWHLISAVTSRARRGRMIRKLADTDGLTGLLNHTRSKQKLESELARAKRERAPLSFAMLDIDHFKQVNDSYGHPAGDRVLKSLANMFKQRLRPYDTVGRYGGEEFVVILPNTDQEQAQAVINELRMRFAEISHCSDDGYFYCTFSSGIASFPDFDNSTVLNDEADKALYEAKQTGRNRVVVSTTG